MLMNNLLRRATLTVATILLTASVVAQTPYDDGQSALREQRWIKAADYFAEAAKSDEDNADAAMYWRAHALYKAGHTREAGRQVRTLVRRAPDSRWVKEARALVIEHEGSADSLAQVGAGDAGIDDELRIFALSHLAQRDIKRALPLVLDFVKNSESSKARNDALFVLGMVDDPEAHEAIAEIARDASDPELQVNAIHILGAASSGPSLALLKSLYTETADREVREAIIYAYIASAETALLQELLKTEKNTGLQVEIIHALGMMDASGELAALYSSRTEPETRMAVLESMAISDDVDGLISVLETEQNVELRVVALQGLAIIDSPESTQYLRAYYPDGSAEEKRAVIHSMMISDDAEGLLDMVKKEKDPDLRREMLQIMMVMGTEESDEYLFELLENEK